MQSVIPKHSHITRIEEELVDEDGKRGRVKVKRLKDIEFEKRYKKELEDAHLVRIDNYNGDDYIELVHDRVADAIMERRKESTKKNRLIVARIASFVALFALFFFTYWIQTIPTSNNHFPYQISQTIFANKKYINYTGDSIQGQFIEAINCHNLEKIVVDNGYSASIKVRGCRNLRSISLSDNYNVKLDLDNCPMLNAIRIPSSVRSLTFANIPPGNLTFDTEESTDYIWKDKILWHKQDTTIVYSRYDAPVNITPPFKSGKDAFAYQPRTFNNEERDSITLCGYDSYSSICIRVSRYEEILDLHTFKITSTKDWEMSKFPNLHEIILPDSLLEIQDYTFKGCKNLQHVFIPSTLQRFGKEAFRGCSSLQTIVKLC